MIQVYGTLGCCDCVKAKMLFNQFNKDFKYYEVGIDISVSEYTEKYGLSVPTIIVDGEKVCINQLREFLEGKK